MPSGPKTLIDKLGHVLTAGIDYVHQRNTPDDNWRLWIENELFPRILFDVQNSRVQTGPGTVAPRSPLGWFNIWEYGAIGIGGNYTAQIQQAIDDAHNSPGGGTVFFPRGTYVVGTLTFYSNVRYQGEGHNITIVQLAPGTNAAVFQSFGFAGLTGGGSSGGVNSFVISDMSIDVNKAQNPTGGIGIQVYGYGFSIRDVRVYNAHGPAGISTEWGTGAGFTLPNNMGAEIFNVHVHHCDNDGFTNAGPHDTKYFMCDSYLNLGRQFAALTTNQGTELMFIGCHAYGLGGTWAYWLETTGNLLLGCIGEGQGTDATHGGQVFIGANDNQISGGHYFSAGANGNNVRGFVVGDATHTGIAGTYINCKITSLEAGSLVFGSDAGTMCFADTYQNAGNFYSGVVDPASQIIMTPSGAGIYAGHVFSVKLNQGGEIAIGLGHTINVKVGGNAKAGTLAQLVGGQLQIFTTAITANSMVFVQRVTPGGTIGELGAPCNPVGAAVAAGFWFFVSSLTAAGGLNALDTSTFNWWIIEPF